MKRIYLASTWQCGQALIPSVQFAMLDDLLDADPEQMPTHIFSSHPDTRNRRNRVEENIISFWSEPEPLGGKRQAEIAELARILTQNRRTDPRSRFALSLSESPLMLGFWFTISSGRKRLFGVERQNRPDIQLVANG